LPKKLLIHSPAISFFYLSPNHFHQEGGTFSTDFLDTPQGDDINQFQKKSGTTERIPDVIEDIRNEKQGIIFV
jgi:hypothetical protein